MDDTRDHAVAQQVDGLLRRALEIERQTGIPLRDMAREGLAMRKSMGLTWTQTLMAANTPMLLKAALVDGKVESGVMASGQVVGVIDDLPTCQELIDRIVAEADDVLQDLTQAEPERRKRHDGERPGRADRAVQGGV